ncbi:MAG: DUF1800 domain-containing protein [Gemmatimonadaceae bacterium]|nr:DUF1800 domain-containing protein [Gemmatimonadaceae bacterium]
MITRRRFLQAGGALAASATIASCNGAGDGRALWDTGDVPPFQPPANGDVDDVAHVLARTTYGARPGDHARVRALGATPHEAIERYLDEQLAPRAHDAPAERAVRRLEVLAEPIGELFEFQPALLRESLAAGALLRAVYAERQLHTVMTGWWADHFNIDHSKGDCRWLTPAFARDVLQPHALGRFPELLRAVVLHPAMLWYLDGRVNRRRSADERPNENYARELLELHTLGAHGGYTQHDVMEVARALTGWTVRSKGESTFGIGRVEFDADAHDNGEKVVLGQVIPAGCGRRDVDEVLQIVVTHPSCAHFLATKLCRHFIADDPPAAAIDAVARTFAATGGEIAPTLRTLFATSAFAAARGTRFKRPFHFVASALRATDATIDDARPLVPWLERLGEVPFQYPTPDGYPDEAAPWLGTLLWRWQFAMALVRGRIEGTRIDATSLVTRAGGDAALLAHLLGRRPSDAELRATRGVRHRLALALSSPGFQLA